MNPRTRLACFAGDAAYWGITRILRRGGGNIPGSIALHVDPELIGSLAEGLGSSIVITGTNGKTTTTGLVADALTAAGRGVVCNRAGNNMDSGIAAAMIQGRSAHSGAAGGAHIRVGCFECDELYTVRVLPRLRPRALVLLNLFRDQLDRYGEIDHTQDVIVEALTNSPTTTLVFNADDPLCAAIANRVPNPHVAFGIDEPTGLEADSVSDSRFCARCNSPLDYKYVHYGQLGSYVCPKCGWKRPRLDFAVQDVILGPDGYEFSVEDRRVAGDPGERRIACKYNGLYMVYNIAAALVATLVMGASVGEFQNALNSYEPAGGRGHEYVFGNSLNGDATELRVVCNLAKNPTGFDRQIAQMKAARARYMAFYLNDNDADGHDISWIWDVDFERLASIDGKRAIFVGGTRAEELAMRIKYAELGVPVTVIKSVDEAIAQTSADGGEKLHVVANYTAFPSVTAELTKLEAAGSWSKNGGHAHPAGTHVAGAPAPFAPVLDRPLRVVHLYPDALNLYGDGGNIASLKKRCEWRGIPVRVDRVLMGQELDLSDADVVLLGGGADRDQLAVCKELLAQREKVAAYVEDGGMLLAICGGYQLLGRYYEMGEYHERIEGLNVIDVWTTAGSTRLIGNVAIDSGICDQPIVGFENHAGRTYLGEGETPLGRSLVHGTGNNGEDGGEGILHKGVVGTYFHGPILPKNPGVTDYLIAGALKRRGFDAELAPLEDAEEHAAHDVAMKIAKRGK